jgi:hypothetical protein
MELQQITVQVPLKIAIARKRNLRLIQAGITVTIIPPISWTERPSHLA